MLPAAPRQIFHRDRDLPHAFRRFEIQERVARRTARCLHREHVHGERRIPRRRQFLARVVIDRNDAADLRRAQFARLQLENVLVAGDYRQRVFIDFRRLGQPPVYGQRQRQRPRHRLTHFREFANRQRQRQCRGIRQVHEGLRAIRLGQIGLHFGRAEGDFHLLPALPAQRVDLRGIRIRPCFQPVKVLRLSGETRVVNLHIVVAGRRERHVQPRIQVQQRRVFAARDLLPGAVHHANHRVNRRPRPPRVHFKHTPLAGLHLQPVHIPFGAAQCAIQRDCRRRQRLRFFNGIIGVRHATGLRLFFIDLRKRAHAEQQDVR